MAGKQVVVRQVWASNLKSEFFHIQKVIRQYTFVSMDTEFPGTIFQSTLNKHFLCYAPDYTYYLMKLNFNFRDFDLQSDPHNAESIYLLEKQGTNLKMHREKGIDSRDFAKLALSSGLVFNYSFTWITFFFVLMIWLSSLRF
ncbi:probable CCR4-associated factor 1 homolog 11 [Hevea brasiliensis]|uniref:probable CCR4-associated factor 1 homolog 11 n=1 Tax=Hevea brasiliensis TaxID=3981 RepID=UPI0025D75BDF|nr:probable CCR4-associated factor 1 homolog 11 [Hevea brasiliensis]